MATTPLVERRAPTAHAPLRAREPDATGVIERDGVRVAWDRYGDGTPTILLLPTWSVIHSRFWKMQIAYLARHFRVVTFDGRGNGRSDRPTTEAAYGDAEFVADACAVLDATESGRAVIVGLSMGGGYALRLAATHPDRVIGAVFIGAAIPLAPPPPKRKRGGDPSFEDPLPAYEGWAKYNAHYWRQDWPGFAEFFAGQIFSEPHSTKAIEDTVGWFLDTDPETIIRTEHAPYLQPPPDWDAPAPGESRALAFIRRVRCPALVIHGDDDHITNHDVGVRLAELLGAPLVTVSGGGHSPLGREPVLVNRLIRAFAESVRDTDP